MNFTKQQKSSMIYPPVDDLVEKVGHIAGDESKANRYSLVLVAAKRAREISQKKMSENTRNFETEGATHAKDRIDKDKRADIPATKPLAEALNEIYKGDVYFAGSENQGEVSESSVKDATIIIDDSGDDIDYSSLMSEAPSNAPVSNGLAGDEIIENE